jgi:hypothetical protein
MLSSMVSVSKDFKKVKRISLGKMTFWNIYFRDKERVIEYFIDRMIFIQLRQYRFILALFENNFARVLDADTLEVVQEL